MASLNKVQLIGRVGRDPEVRENGFTVANVSLATSYSWTDKSGHRQEETEWHKVVFYNRSAEVIRDYLKKGSQIYVEGRLKTRKYTGQDGIERYVTEIVTDSFQFLDSKGESAAQPQPAAKPTQAKPAASKAQPTHAVEDEFADEDGVPF